MKKTSLLLFFIAQSVSHLLSFSVNNTPLCIVYTPNSILEHKEDFMPLYIDGQQRYATCTGATWFHDNYLAVLNLYGEKINTYTLP